MGCTGCEVGGQDQGEDADGVRDERAWKIQLRRYQRTGLVSKMIKAHRSASLASPEHPPPSVLDTDSWDTSWLASLLWDEQVFMEQQQNSRWIHNVLNTLQPTELRQPHHYGHVHATSSGQLWPRSSGSRTNKIYLFIYSSSCGLADRAQLAVTDARLDHIAANLESSPIWSAISPPQVPLVSQ